MKTKSVLTGVAAAALCVATVNPMAINAAGLSWKDGARANYHFTYAGDTGHIDGVYVSDTNGTFGGNIEKGQTVTTQTGTIVWRDSYTNTTTIKVDVADGYELTSITGNVGDGEFKEIDHANSVYEITFTDKGAEAWCYGDDVSFTLNTQAREFNLYEENGKDDILLQEGIHIGDALPEEGGKNITGYEFTGWDVKDDVVTKQMAMSADENDNIYLKGNYEKVKYNITFERYGDNTFGKDGSERFENIVKTIPYGTWVDNNYIHNVLGISSEFKVAGGRVYIDSADDIVKLVDPRPEESRVLNTTYSFTYAGNNDKVRSVTYSVDGGESHELLLNETIHVNPGRNLLNYDTVTFTVKVADGEELQLDCPGRRNEITKLDNNTYQFAITVNGYNHDKQAHFDFYLK